MNVLEQIVARTRSEVQQRRRSVPLAELQERAAARTAQDPPRGFASALDTPGLALIAEHKRRSPSAGRIRDELALEDVVSSYQRGGAAALSVLTETASFGGALEDLGRARAACRLPILRKDFIVEAYQVAEALTAGADAILLIVAALDPGELETLWAQALELGLDVLVEVHNEAELEVAAGLQGAVGREAVSGSGARMVGINNRDLTTLEVDTNRIHELLPRVPDGALVVAESGFRTRADLDRLADAGVDAVLVGEGLMRAPDIEAACRALTGVRSPTS